MHVAPITSHFASLASSEVIRGRASRRVFACRLSHRRNRTRVESDAETGIDHRLLLLTRSDCDTSHITRLERLAVHEQLALLVDLDLVFIDRLALAALLARGRFLPHGEAAG